MDVKVAIDAETAFQLDAVRDPLQLCAKLSTHLFAQPCAASAARTLMGQVQRLERVAEVSLLIDQVGQLVGRAEGATFHQVQVNREV